MGATLQEMEAFGKVLNDLVLADRTIVPLDLWLSAAADQLQISAYPQVFFIADRAYQVESIREVHDTAQTSADGASLMVSKVTGTTAPNATDLNLIDDIAYSGSAVTFKGFNLKGIAANTVTNGTMTNQVSSLNLAAGDRLVWGINGTIASTFIGLTVSLKKI